MRKENVMQLNVAKIYLALAKPFLRIGNYLMNKHVKALREKQKKDGIRRL